MPERDVGTVLAYSLSGGWTVLMLHLLPEEHKTDYENRTDGQGGIMGSQGREKTQPRKEEPDPSKSLSDFISKDGHGIAQYL